MKMANIGSYDREYIINKISGPIVTNAEFLYNQLQAPPLYSLLSQDDIYQLNKLATSIRYSSKPIEKLEMIDRILRNRGFVKFAGGTNRVVYRFLEDSSFVIKVATDSVALGDNPREFINQFRYKPFVTKCFEVSPCGTVGIFERVKPITSREEFESVAEQVLCLLNNWLVGLYVMDDIGTDSFMNFGIRTGRSEISGVVLLDFPYSYPFDRNKAYCNRILDNGMFCGGVIDYDDGYNHLRCTKCGKIYKARDLARFIEEGKIIKSGGETKMKVALCRGNDVKFVTDSKDRMDTVPKLVSKKAKRSKVGHLRVQLPGAPEYVPYVEEDYEPKVKALLRPRNEVKVVSEDEVEVIEPEKVENIEITTSYDTPKEENNDDYENESEEEEAGFDFYGGAIVRSADLDGDEENSKKVLCITDKEDESYLVGDNGYYFAIDEIGGVSLNDISIITKEAENKLYSRINELNEESDELSKTLKEYEEKISELEAELQDTQQKLKKAEDDYPFYIDKEGNKRWKSNNNIFKEKAPRERSTEVVAVIAPEDEVEEEFDEDSDEYNQINPAKPIEEMHFDVKSKFIPKPDDLPVGAVPPSTAVTQNKPKSAKFNSDPKNPYYNTPSNKKGKKK